MRRPRAVLLDLDDTILDDTGGVVSSWRQACVAHRSHMNGLDADAVFDAIDRMREWYWSDPERHRIGRLELAWARGEVVRLALAELGVEDDVLARKIGDTYHALRDEAITPIDDSVPTVEWLRTQGCRLALITNGGSRLQRIKIDRFGLAPLFDTILIEGEVGFGKPDPRIYTRALDALDVPACDAWMVGDNLEWDVAGPQREGIAGIWIDALGKIDDPGVAFIPPVLFGAAMPIGVYFWDNWSTFRRGVPASISAGLALGGLEGMAIASLNWQHASDDGQWSFATQTTVTFLAATGGGLGGYFFGEWLNPDPRSVAYIASGAGWGASRPPPASGNWRPRRPGN